MATYEDLLEMANRGADAAFPARKLARQALLAKTQAPLHAARAQDPAAFDTAMKSATKESEALRANAINAIRNAGRGALGMSTVEPSATSFKDIGVDLNEGEFGTAPSMSRRPGMKRRDFDGFKKGGKVSSASKRADGIATKGKTRGKMI